MTSMQTSKNLNSDAIIIVMSRYLIQYRGNFIAMVILATTV